MKFKSLLTISALVSFIAFQGCKKGTGESMMVFVAPTHEEFSQTRAEALSSLKQHFHIDAQQGGSFTSSKGVTVYFPPNSFRINGNPVYGEVDIEYIEIINRGDMLVSGISALNLVSGGAFFVKAIQGEYDADMHIPYEITVPGSLTHGVDEDMVLFTGGYFSENIVNGWERIVSGSSHVEFGPDTYKATVNYCGWSNIAKEYTDPRPKTTVKAVVPPNCAMDNASVCITYQGTKHLLTEFGKANDLQAHAHFIDNHGQIPIGQVCHILFFTAKGDDWAYVIHETTILENHLETFDAEEIKSVSKNELLELVNQLP